MSRRSGALALAVSFAALAALVASGALTGVDQWAVDHLMPGLSPSSRESSLLEAAIPLLHAHWRTTLEVVANVVTLPAQALLSTALAGLCCLLLHRRGRTGAAFAWAGAWLVGNLVEVLCKSVLERPLLHARGLAVVGFQASWPSGHTVRSILLVAVVVAVWPAALRWVAAWAVATLVLLELAGFHVPTDILGGALLAALLIVLVRERRPAR